MKDSGNLFLQIITEYIERLSLELKAASGNDFEGSFRTGSWLEKQKIVLGFISINPHSDPEEEAIDIGFKIEVFDNLNVAIDICWSDGEMLREIAKETFPLISFDKTVLELEHVLINVIPDIFGEVDKIIKKKLPPRYRTN
jgi:hypothetical protein